MRTTSARQDADLVQPIGRHDHDAFEALMRQHNARLFRIARAILRDDGDAEDAVQDGYLDAYRHIDSFRGDAQLGTWLVRIVANRALMRLRKQKRERIVVPFERDDVGAGRDKEAELPDQQAESPSAATLRAEIRRMLEHRIDELPVAAGARCDRIVARVLGILAREHPDAGVHRM